MSPATPHDPAAREAIIRRRAIAAFPVGSRVQTAPHTDAWMRGNRFGDVTRHGPRFVHVRLDGDGRTYTFHPADLAPVE